VTHADAVVGKLEDADQGVRATAVETLGKLSSEALAPLLAQHTSLTAAAAVQVVAELAVSRWCPASPGTSNDDGMTHTVDADLCWGEDDGSEKQYTISHIANLVTTNGWWVQVATFETERLAALEWRHGPDRITWHQVD